MKQYPHVVNYVLSTPWAIEVTKFTEISAALARVVAGETLSDAEIEAIAAARPQRASTAGSAVAVLPIYGTIAHRGNTLEASSGGTSTEAVAAALRQLVNDPHVSAIVLDVDSPGGAVTGVGELADEVYRARAKKPVVAVANSLAASAAYWIASQADELVVYPSGDVGSIGVFAAHQDVSKAMEKRGITMTYISAGRRKVEGNPFEPLSEEARQHMQEQVDHYYSQFTRAVARGRGVPVADARGERFGEGRVYRASVAVERGMADRVATLEQVVEELAGGKWRRPERRMMADVLDEVQVIAEAGPPLPEASGVAEVEPVDAPTESEAEAVVPSGPSIDLRRRRIRLA